MKKVVIGDATLILGDCLDVLPTLSGDCIITDPPYGINAKLGMGGGAKGDGGMWAGIGIEGDSSVEVRDAAIARARLPFATFGKWNVSSPAGACAAVVWSKGEHTGAGNLLLPWKPDFDLVFIGGKGWSWHRRGSGIVHANAIAGCVADRNTGKRFHPFEKPVEIMAHFCRRAPGKTIIDPFMGSGTTGVACLRTGRKFVGVEIDERYFEIACSRIQTELDRSALFAGIANETDAKQGVLVEDA